MKKDRKPKKTTKKKVVKKTEKKSLVETEQEKIIKPPDGEIISVPSVQEQMGDIEHIPPDTYLALAEKRIEFMNKVIRLAIKSTNHRDWVNMGKNPYLCGSGAEKIARNFGIIVDNLKKEKIEGEDEKGKYYYFIVEGRCSMPSRLMNSNGEPLADSIPAIGTCSSRDQFFSKAHGRVLPLSEIDQGNIVKAAYTNMLVNGITRLLGLRNLTWAELKEQGINPDSIAEVTYKGKSENKPEPPKEKPPEVKDPDDAITDKQKYYLENRIIKSHLLKTNEKDFLTHKLHEGITKGDASKLIDEWQKIIDQRREQEKTTEKRKAEKAEKDKKSQEKSETESETKTEKEPDEKDKFLPAVPDQFERLSEIIMELCVQPFEKYLLNIRASDEKLTMEKARQLISHWNDEIEKRKKMREKSSKEYARYCANMEAQAMEMYPDDYLEYTQGR